MSGSRNQECRSSSRRSSSLDVHRPLELPPDLAHGLVARALHRGPAVRTRRVPVGDVDRDDVRARRCRRTARGATLAPEAELGDAGQRPFGVDVDRRGRAPSARRGTGRTARRSSIRRSGPAARRLASDGSAASRLGVDQRRHPLERQRRHVVVAVHDGRACPAGPPSTPVIRASSQRISLDLRIGQVVDAARLEVAEPGIDPDEVGRPVEHPVGRSGRSG